MNFPQLPITINEFYSLSLMQTQIQSKDFSKKTLANLRRVVAKGFEEGDLHLLNLCEVGGHKQGLPAVHCHASNITDQALKEDEYHVVWG